MKRIVFSPSQTKPQEEQAKPKEEQTKPQEENKVRRIEFSPSQTKPKEENTMKRIGLFLLAIVIGVCFSGTELLGSTIISPEDGVSVELAIHKEFVMPRGTTTPDVNFSFHAERISVDGISTPEAIASMPNLNTLKTLAVSYDATDTGPVGDDNLIRIRKETEDLFDGIIFPHAGLYIYRITENQTNNPEVDRNLPDEVLNYSQAVYELHVHVANDDAGTARFVKYVVIWDMTPDENEDPAEEKAGQMLFVNDYVKTNTIIDPADEDATVDITKTVTGDLGNRTMYFSFSMTLSPPVLVVPRPEYYKAYIVEGDTVLADIADNLTDTTLTGSDATGPYIMVSTSGPTNFRLRHGQRLAFVDTPVGTDYEVTELAAEGHTASVIVTRVGAEVTTLANTQANQQLATGPQFVGEPTNRAAFTNNRTSIVPTGLNMNNLPFVGLIVLPVLALIGFIVVKSRRRNNAA